MSYENAEHKWATSKIVEESNREWSRLAEPCKNPIVTDVQFEDGEGDIQIGDYTWDYDEDSVTIHYLNDDGEPRRFYFEQKFSELLNELIRY